MASSEHADKSIFARPFVFSIALALLGFVTHAWLAVLEFQLDDFEQLHQAADRSRPAVLLGQDSGEQTALRSRPTFVSYFRPALHASFALDLAVFGADATALHLMSVAWHVLTCILLYRVLLRLLPAAPASYAGLAALAFLLMPGKLGAVAWVAARGDVMAATFLLAALLALVRLRRTGGTIAAVGVFLFCVLSILAKEGALVAPLIVAAIDRFIPTGATVERARAKRRWLAVTLVALPAAYLLFRRVFFGEYANYYAGQVRTITPSIIWRMMADILPTFERLLGGSFHAEEGSLTAGVQSWTTLGLVATIALWSLRRPLERLRIVAFLAAIYIVAALPILRFYQEASGFDASRLFYLPALVVAAAIGIPLHWMRTRVPLLRYPALALVLLLAVSWGLAYRAQIGAQLTAARIIERVREDLSMVARSHDEACAWLVTGIPIEVGRVPLYGTFLGFAFRETFVDQPLQVRSVLSTELLLRDGALYRAYRDIPVRMLKWVDDTGGGRLETNTGLLPAATGRNPRLELDQEGHGRLAQPISVRDAPTPAIELDREPSQPFELTVSIASSAGETFRLDWSWSPVHGSARRFVVDLMRDLQWLELGTITRVDAVSVGTDAPRVVAVDFGGKLPAIEPLAPVDVDCAIDGPEPRLRFRDPHAFPWYRIHLYIEPVLVWTLPRDRFTLRDDGSLEISLSTPGFLPDERPIYWEELRPGGRADLLAERGVDAVEAAWRIEGLRGDFSAGKPGQGGSEVVGFRIVRSAR